MARFFQASSPSCQPINRVKTLKETQSTDRNPACFILSSSSTNPITEERNIAPLMPASQLPHSSIISLWRLFSAIMKTISQTYSRLECRPMPNMMVTLSNIGGILCSLFNATKFGWRSLLDCRAVMLQDAKPVEISWGAPNSRTDLSH